MRVVSRCVSCGGGDAAIDAGEIVCGKDRTRLTAWERALLRYLAERSGEVVSPKELVEQVWGYASGGVRVPSSDSA